MSKLRRIFKFIDVPSLVPSIFVSLIHFRLSIDVQPYANEAFQRWFDTGERVSGSLAVLNSINALLSIPIPTVWFASHPSQPLPTEWWIYTAINSIFWGGFLYTLYKVSNWLFRRWNLI